MNGTTAKLRPTVFVACAAGALLLLSLLPVPCVAASAATRVAVMDFAVNGVEAHLGRSVAELIITDLTGTAGCEVVERGQLERLAREHRLQASGLVDSQTAVKMGKLAGAAYVIVGSVNAMQQTYILAARLVDVQRGTSLSGFKSVSTTGEAGLYDATERLTADIVANFGGAVAPSPTKTPPGRPTPVPTRPPLPTPRPVVTPKADANTIALDLTKDPGRPLFKGQYASESITDQGTALVAKKEGQGVTVNRALPADFSAAPLLEAEVVVSYCDGALVGLVMTGSGGNICFDVLSDGRTRVRANPARGKQAIVRGDAWGVSWPATLLVRYDARSKTFTGFANGRKVISIALSGRSDIPAFHPTSQIGFYAIGRTDVGAGDYAIFSKMRITAAP